MPNHDHLREIAVLPCLPPGLSVEDSMLERSSPCFDLQHAVPNAALGRMLTFLDVSKRHFVELVKARRGINLLSSKPQGTETGAYRYRGEYAADWRGLKIAHDPQMPALLDDDEIVEIFENASAGGQMAIAGYVDRDAVVPRAPHGAVTLTGRFQIGIIDYIWGSGHTVTYDGALTVDLADGQLIDAPGYAYDSVCGFVVSYFEFRSITATTLPRGRRFDSQQNPITD